MSEATPVDAATSGKPIHYQFLDKRRPGDTTFDTTRDRPADR